MLEERETLTKDDLHRVYIRVQEDDSQRWISISAKEASDCQFDAWARSRMQILGGSGPWSPEERADFCNQLYQAGVLCILKKDVELE